MSYPTKEQHDAMQNALLCGHHPASYREAVELNRRLPQVRALAAAAGAVLEALARYDQCAGCGWIGAHRKACTVAALRAALTAAGCEV